MRCIEEILGNIERIEPFPAAAVRVLELAMGDASNEEIVAVVSTDPGLTAKILRLANSARLAPIVPIESIPDATARLGSKAIVSMVLSTGCASYFMGYGSSSPGSNYTLWEECLHTALVARRIAGLVGFADPELAYSVGLLQNVGHIVLDRFMSAHRDDIAFLMERGHPLWSAEYRVIGMNHAECGARIVERWGLPESFVNGIRCHHEPAMGGEHRALCAVAEKAEAITALALGNQDLSLLESTESGCGSLQVDAYDVLGLLAAVDAELRETSFMLT